jgi:hypothetical protein
MARKTLLNESEIRRFMKLANMKPVGDQRLSEMYDMPGQRDEEEEADVEMDMADDAPADDMDMDMELDAEEEPAMDMDDDAPVGGAQINLDDFLSALESALEDVTGEEVSTDMDMDADEEEMDMGDEGGDLDSEPMDDAEPMGDVEVDMEMSDDDEEDLMEARVNRIAQRVAKRLMAENKKASNIDTLTERIFQRLAGK